jgi:hypothetical protein
MRICASDWLAIGSVRAGFISSPHRHSGPSVQPGPRNRSNDMKTPANKSSDHQPRGSERKATGATNMEHFNQMVKVRRTLANRMFRMRARRCKYFLSRSPLTFRSFPDFDPLSEFGLLILWCAILGVGSIVVTHVAAVLNALVKILPLPFGCALCTSCRRITNDPRRKFLRHKGSAFFRNFCRDGWDALRHQ